MESQTFKKRKNIKKGTNSSKKTFFQVSSPRFSWLASITFFFKPSKTLGKPSHVLKIDKMATGSCTRCVIFYFSFVYISRFKQKLQRSWNSHLLINLKAVGISIYRVFANMHVSIQTMCSSWNWQIGFLEIDCREERFRLLLKMLATWIINSYFGNESVV